jgi:two-component system response regulator GlrR
MSLGGDVSGSAAVYLITAMKLVRTTNQLPERSPSPDCHIDFLLGPDAARSVMIPPDGISLGSGFSADLRSNDPDLAPLHCRITPERNGFRVHALSEQASIFVDDRRLSDAHVAAGTALRMANTLLRLSPGTRLELVGPSERESFGALRGRCDAMRRVYALLERASASAAPVLITGERGTGKELAARALHQRRGAGQFHVVDCGKLERDASSTRGEHAFEALASSDTLFLDEVGDLPIELQPQLLDALSQATLEGGRSARVIAGTRRNLWHAVLRGTFRADLYHRLAVFDIALPSLRERRGDVAILVQHFLAAERPPRGPKLESLLRHSWRGNVRELRNALMRARALAHANAPFEELPILLSDSEPPPSDRLEVSIDEPFVAAKEQLVARFERKYLRALLAAEGRNLAQAARRAGIQRKHLYRLLNRHGLKRQRPSVA